LPRNAISVSCANAPSSPGVVSLRVVLPNHQTPILSQSNRRFQGLVPRKERRLDLQMQKGRWENGGSHSLDPVVLLVLRFGWGILISATADKGCGVSGFEILLPAQLTIEFGRLWDIFRNGCAPCRGLARRPSTGLPSALLGGRQDRLAFLGKAVQRRNHPARTTGNG